MERGGMASTVWTTAERPRLALVTGGLGFLGRHLCGALVEEGLDVRVLDLADPGDPTVGGLPERVERRRGSVLDRGAVRRALEGTDLVFHLAAISNLWTERKADYLRVNRDGTRVVLQEAERARVRGFVHVSSHAVRKVPRRRADREPRLRDMAGAYCRSKFLADREAERAAAAGSRVVIVRPAVPIGPGDPTPTPPTRMLRGFLNGDFPAYLDAKLDLVDVRDVARGCLLAAGRGAAGDEYLLGNARLRMGELLRILEELTGLPMPRRRLPWPVALAVGLVQEAVADLLTGRRPAAPLTGVRLARRPTVDRGQKGWEALGQRPRPIRSSLLDAIEWLRRTGRLRRPVRLPGEDAAPRQRSGTSYSHRSMNAPQWRRTRARDSDG